MPRLALVVNCPKCEGPGERNEQLVKFRSPDKKDICDACVLESLARTNIERVQNCIRRAKVLREIQRMPYDGPEIEVKTP